MLKFLKETAERFRQRIVHPLGIELAQLHPNAIYGLRGQAFRSIAHHNNLLSLLRFAIVLLSRLTREERRW